MEENLPLAVWVFYHIYLPIARFWPELCRHTSKTERFLTLIFLNQISANMLESLKSDISSKRQFVTQI